MKLKRRHKREVPVLQLTAMPDLIFTILFFFMCVTHMRSNTPQMELSKPLGTNLLKVSKNAEVIDIFVGQGKIQVNNKVVPMHKLGTELRKLNGGWQVASIQADESTPMSTINKVKTELRKANILKINYSGTNETVSRPTE